jgi:UDP-N-acetylglucosamine 2-epimerase
MVGDAGSMARESNSAHVISVGLSNTTASSSSTEAIRLAMMSTDKELAVSFACQARPT